MSATSFGDYDRDALLAESLDEHSCYLSLADDQCYDDAAEVHADHIVALAEAWRSGLAESDTDAIAEDLDNLWLMMQSNNSKLKSSRSIGESGGSMWAVKHWPN